MPRRRPNPEPDLEIDLHKQSGPQALRRLEQGLHTARVRGARRVRVITGRGWGSAQGQSVLTPLVRQWLEGERARDLGIASFQSSGKGGAFDITLQTPSDHGRPPR